MRKPVHILFLISLRRNLLAEDIRNQVEEFVRKDVQLQDGEKFFISKEVVHKCWHKIWRWISVSTVGPHLLKYGVVKDSMDLNLHNPYFTPQQKAEQLLHLATQSGECGYHILYMCIRDDDENPLGHASAVEELVKEGNSLNQGYSLINSNHSRLFFLQLWQIYT